MTDDRRHHQDLEDSGDPTSVRLRWLRADLDRLRDESVTRTEFEPIKRLMYGLVSLVLAAVVGALLFLVIK